MRRIIRQNIDNIHGWRTNRKIVVIESDDWGSIRTRSKEDLEILRQNNIKVDKCNYMLNDCLASETDLKELFNILSSFKDIRGNHPVITANCLVANPDFRKIKDSGFSKYYFETFIETLKRYPQHKNSINLWKEGIIQGIFHPQSHGREHLNISRWMSDLKDGIDETHLSFEMEMFGISTHISKYNRGSYQAAFDGYEKDLKYDKSKIIKEGLILFKQIFGYDSFSFIAPNYVWDDKLEKALLKNGVRYIQGARFQSVSNTYGENRVLRKHYLGQKNKLDQLYLVRNCQFEPSLKPEVDWVNRCLKDIKIAFRWNKPAIISTHRVNYMGSINPDNRNNNLILLNDLIKRVLKEWPETVFMTSDQLGHLMIRN